MRHCRLWGGEWLHSLLLLALTLLYICGGNCQEFLNLSIPLNSTQITYTPFVCSFAVAQADPQACAGTWRLSSDNKSISTTGPSAGSNNFIPQLFFQFRAIDLILTTLPSSNASLNITASSNGTTVSRLFNSTLRLATIINLPATEVSQLTLTFVPSNVFTSFDLQDLTITTLSNGTITSILPSQILPPSIELPAFVPPTSTSSGTAATSLTATPVQAHSAKGKRIAEAVGLTVGLGLGLTVVLSGTFIFWRRRRRHHHRSRSRQSSYSERGRNRHSR